MLALYRSGGQADALRWFEQTRRHLASEIGIDPGAQLRTLHQRILHTDPALAAPAAGRPRARIVPRQSASGARVHRPDGRVGRARPAAPRARAAGKEPSPAEILAISGTAGVGKTALAVHWARRVARRFRDGHLHADLRGFDHSGAPASAPEVIRTFLAVLGVPPDCVPPGEEAQAALYRSMLADRRMLVVLDNAHDQGQIRPLLPRSPRSLVLVTSRNQLTGLAATDGARLITLDLLPHHEAVQLLTARLGPPAVAEPAAVSEIVSLCARLPFAVAVAAARAGARPSFPLAALAAELRDAAGRLDALDSGDPAASVRALFSWSYNQLSTGAARMFRLLGLHSDPDITVPAAANLAGLDETAGRRLLRELSRAQLLTEHRPGRYSVHDLLRAYAADQARVHDEDPARANSADSRAALDWPVVPSHARRSVSPVTSIPVAPD